MDQAAAYLQLAVYEDSVNLLGIAEVTLPNIAYQTTQIKAAGIMGNLDVPLIGMMDSMTMSLKFLSMTQSPVSLSEPRKHQLDLRVAEEFWATEEAEVGIWANRYVVICQPKNMTPGTVAPFTAADVSMEFEVYS